MAEGRTAWPKVADEWFVEAVSVTAWLLDLVRLSAPIIWDPACGQGNVLRAAKNAGYSTIGSDIRERAGVREVADQFDIRDFLAGRITRPSAGERRALVTNPPYGRGKLTEAFTRRALAMSFVDEVCVLVNAKFLWGQARAIGLWSEHPPDLIFPVNPRPSIPPGEYLLAGGKAEGGVESFAWLYWRVPAERTGAARFVW